MRSTLAPSWASTSVFSEVTSEVMRSRWRLRSSSGVMFSASATSEAKAKFRRAFEDLPKREREVAVLLYVKNLTLREIGNVLGVSESRVCQIHGELKKTLRRALENDAELLRDVA